MIDLPIVGVFILTVVWMVLAQFIPDEVLQGLLVVVVIYAAAVVLCFIYGLFDGGE